jgi:hypothetical protein
MWTDGNIADRADGEIRAVFVPQVRLDNQWAAPRCDCAPIDADPNYPHNKDD